MVYPARQEKHCVGEEGEQVAHGGWQVRAQVKVEVKEYPVMQVLQTLLWEQEEQWGVEQSWHLLLVLRKSPVPQLKHSPGAPLEQDLQLERQGTQTPALLVEKPETQVVQTEELEQTAQLLGHPFTQILLFRWYPLRQDVHTEGAELWQVRQFEAGVHTWHDPSFRNPLL